MDDSSAAGRSCLDFKNPSWTSPFPVLPFPPGTAEPRFGKGNFHKLQGDELWTCVHLLRVIVPCSANVKHFHTEQNSCTSLQNSTKLSPEDAKGSSHPPIPNPRHSKLAVTAAAAALLQGREELQAFPEGFFAMAHTPEQSVGWEMEGAAAPALFCQHLRAGAAACWRNPARIPAGLGASFPLFPPSHSIPWPEVVCAPLSGQLRVEVRALKNGFSSNCYNSA